MTKIVVISYNFDAVRMMIEKYVCIKYREIKASLGATQTAKYSIFPEHLTAKSVFIPDAFHTI